MAWGHSAADYPVRLAELAGAKAVLLFHHDPIRTDDEVDAIVASLRRRPRPGRPPPPRAPSSTSRSRHDVGYIGQLRR